MRQAEKTIWFYKYCNFYPFFTCLSKLTYIFEEKNSQYIYTSRPACARKSTLRYSRKLDYIGYYREQGQGNQCKTTEV